MAIAVVEGHVVLCAGKESMDGDPSNQDLEQKCTTKTNNASVERNKMHIEFLDDWYE